jgi:hypothetical protein
MSTASLLASANFGTPAHYIPEYETASYGDAWYILIGVLLIILLPRFIAAAKNPQISIITPPEFLAKILDKHRPFGINLQRLWIVITVLMVTGIMYYQVPRIQNQYNDKIQQENEKHAEKSMETLNAKIGACKKEKNITDLSIYHLKCQGTDNWHAQEFCVRIRLIEECGIATTRPQKTLWQQFTNSLATIPFWLNTALAYTLLMIILLPITFASLPSVVLTAIKWLKASD